MKKTLLISALFITLVAFAPSSTHATSFSVQSAPQTPTQTPVQTVLLTSIQTGILTDISSAIALAQNKALLVLSNGHHVVLQLFAKGDGTPTVVVTPNKKKLIAIKENGRTIRSFNLVSLKKTSTNKTRKKSQASTFMQLYRVDGKNLVVVSTRKGKKVRTTTYRLTKKGKLLRRNTDVKTIKRASGSPQINAKIQDKQLDLYIKRIGHTRQIATYAIAPNGRIVRLFE